MGQLSSRTHTGKVCKANCLTSYMNMYLCVNMYVYMNMTYVNVYGYVCMPHRHYMCDYFRVHVFMCVYVHEYTCVCRRTVMCVYVHEYVHCIESDCHMTTALSRAPAGPRSPVAHTTQEEKAPGQGNNALRRRWGPGMGTAASAARSVVGTSRLTS